MIPKDVDIRTDEDDEDGKTNTQDNWNDLGIEQFVEQMLSNLSTSANVQPHTSNQTVSRN
jgi:hypothetical protein